MKKEKNMKKKTVLKRNLAILLGSLIGFTSFVACNVSTTEEKIPVSLPNYLDDRELDLLAYVNPTNGDYTFNDIPYNTGLDLRTAERFAEYKDAGMNIAFARYDSALPANVTAETWEQSDTKLFCDMAYAGGLEKILITDNYLTNFITTNETKLIGDVFETEEELDADEELDAIKAFLESLEASVGDEPAVEKPKAAPTPTVTPTPTYTAPVEPKTTTVEEKPTISGFDISKIFKDD